MDDNIIKGHVKITDNKTKKILVDKDNLILNTGRAYFFDFLVRQLLGNLSSAYISANSQTYNDAVNNVDSTSTSAAFINALVVGSNNIATTSDYELITSKSNSFELDSSKNDITISVNKTLLSSSKESFCVKLSMEINKSKLSDLKTICEVGLKMADGNLFSRVNFDPLQIEDETSFTLEYFLYV